MIQIKSAHNKVFVASHIKADHDITKELVDNEFVHISLNLLNKICSAGLYINSNIYVDNTSYRVETIGDNDYIRFKLDMMSLDAKIVRTDEVYVSGKAYRAYVSEYKFRNKNLLTELLRRDSQIDTDAKVISKLYNSISDQVGWFIIKSLYRKLIIPLEKKAIIHKTIFQSK